MYEFLVYFHKPLCFLSKNFLNAPAEVVKVLRIRNKRGIQDVLKLEKSIERRGVELELIEANRTRKMNETRTRSTRRGGRFCLIRVS